MKESFQAEPTFKESALQALQKKCFLVKVGETHSVSYITVGELKNNLDECFPICEPLKMVVKACFMLQRTRKKCKMCTMFYF